MDASLIVAALITGQVQEVSDPVAVTEALAAGRVEYIAMAATSTEGQAALEAALALKPASPVFLVDIGTGPDPSRAMAAGMADYGLDCGVLASAITPDLWQIAALGICIRGQSDAANLAPPQPAPTVTETNPPSTDASSSQAQPAQVAAGPTLLEGPPSGGARMVGSILELIPHLGEQSNHDGRITALTDVMAGVAGDAELSSRLGQAMAVLSALDRAQRDDPTVVRFFLRGALSDDGEIRAQTLQAATSDGDPPQVGDDALAYTFSTPVASDLSIELPPLYQDRSPLAMAYKEYHRKHMVRGTTALRFDNVGRPVHKKRPTWKWVVYRGHTSLSPKGFALQVGDRAMLRRLEHDTQQVRMISNILFGVVGVAVVGELALIAAHSDRDPYEDPSLLVLPMTVIIPALPWAIVMPFKVSKDQKWTFNYYSTTKASGLIRAHNDELQDDLGITDEQMKALDERE